MNTNNKIIKIEDIKNLSLDMMIEAVRNGYAIEGNEPLKMEELKNIETLAANCTITSKKVGQVVTLSASPSGGTAPYRVVFTKNGIALGNSFTYVAEGATVTTTYTLVASDVGSQVFGAYTVDNCLPNALTSSVQSCSVNVTASITLSSNKTTITSGDSITFSGTYLSGKNVNINIDNGITYNTLNLSAIIPDINGNFTFTTTVLTNTTASAITYKIVACDSGILGLDCNPISNAINIIVNIKPCTTPNVAFTIS